MSFLGDQGPAIVFAVGAGLAVWILMRRLRGSISSTSPPMRPLQALRDQAAPSAHEAPTAMLRWQVELHEIARDTKAELDTKMRALQALTLAAQEATERLEQAIARAERLGMRESPEPFIEPASARSSEIQRITLAARERVYSLADSDQSPIQIAARTGLPVGDVEFLLGLRTPSVGKSGTISERDR